MQYYCQVMSKVMESISLLNTREAAHFLRVSEASIRRWSDSGLLPAQRVGRRRERRFAQSDLVKFLGKPSGDSQPAVTETSTVNVGGASVPLRAHLAPIYSTDLGGLRLSVPFLADGLRAGQPCFLNATGPEAVGQEGNRKPETAEVCAVDGGEMSSERNRGAADVHRGSFGNCRL